MVAKRRMEVDVMKSKVSFAVKRLAQEFFSNNISANSFRRTADDKRKLLLAAMREDGIQECIVTYNGQKLKVDIHTEEVDVVDMVELKKRVTKEQFDRIVKATKKDVVEIAGADVAAVVCKAKTRSPNVYVQLMVPGA